jgi:hypothetical protein
MAQSLYGVTRGHFEGEGGIEGADARTIVKEGVDFWGNFA